jgi:hypothetical protein
VIALLKWTTLAYVVLLAAAGACFKIVFSDLLHPAAEVVLMCMLAPFLVPPLLLVLAIEPVVKSSWLGLVSGIAVYLWLFGLAWFCRLLCTKPAVSP